MPVARSTTVPAASVGHPLSYALVLNAPTKTKKGAQKALSTGEQADRIDLRKFSEADRKMLSKGSSIVVLVGKVSSKKIPRALFIAMSTKPELLRDGVVQLPATLESHGAHHFLNFITTLLWSSKKQLHMNVQILPLATMFSVIAAAQAMGMSKYADNVYRACEWKIRNTTPSYEELDRLLMLKEYLPRLFSVVANDNLAIQLYDGTIGDEEEFKAYLEKNEALGKAVYGSISRYEAWLAREEKKAQKQQKTVGAGAARKPDGGSY